MPLPKNRRLIPNLLQKLGKGLLVSVEGVSIRHEAIQVAMFPSQNHRPARAADRIGDITTVEKHPLPRKTIHVWSRHTRRIVGAEGLLAVIIGENEHDIRAGGCQRRNRGRGKTKK